MEGLINQSMQTPQEPVQEPEGEVSPQEQEQYDRVVTAAMKIIYDDEAGKSLLEAMGRGKDSPVEALTQSANTILQHINQQAGGIPKEIMVAASEEVLSMLAEIADKAGLFKVDENIIEQTSVKMAQTLIGDQNVQQAG